MPSSASRSPPAFDSRAYDDALAQGLVWLLAGVALLFAVVGGLPALLGEPTAASRGRLALAACAALGVVVAWLLLRGGRPRGASVAAMALALAGADLQAVLSGAGPYSVPVAVATVSIAYVGVLGGLGPALALTALQALAAAGLIVHAGDAQAPGREALGPGGLAVHHALLLACGLLGAWVTSRIVQLSHVRASAGERRLADILAVSNDWIYEADAEGRLTWISPAFENRTGRRVEDFLHLGEPGRPRIVEDEHWARLKASLRARRPYRDAIIRFACPDGSELVCSGCAEPRFDAQGRHIGWWGASRNVTEDFRAQRELDRSRALLDSLFRLSPDATCVARLDRGTILLANPAFIRLAARPPEQVLGSDGLALGLWDEPAGAYRLRDALLADGIVRDQRARIVVQGQRWDVLVSAVAFDDAGGDRVAVITVRDVTEVEQARRQTDAILDNATVGLALVRERRFERVNPVFEALLGHPPGSLAGQSTRTVFPSSERHAEFGERTQRALAAGETIELVWDAQRADGVPRTLRLRAGPVDRREPLARGTIWAAEDITDRQAAERELAEAKRQAEAASRAKSAFLATMSHEIRTPLNGVLGLARLLRDDGVDETRRRAWVGHLVASAELLAGTVSDVLDLSKIEAGHLELESIAFDLPELLAAVWAGFEPLGREKGLAMELALAPALPRRVRGDPVRVRQIVANYLSNALKFTARGRIALAAWVPAAGRVRLEVRDTGAGVPPDVQARLFRPFAQADGSTTRRYGGTGLGLSICRELAERMGGAVGVDSDGRSGSLFWAELQLTPVADGTGAAVSSASPGPEPLAGLQVLVAEDNAVNMLIVATLLRRLGASVLEAGDGVQAVRLAREHAGRLDAVLMDLHMPLQDGLTATRRLRADPRTADLPVYALSAAVLEHERNDAAAAGMNGFIAKPVSEPDLLRVLAARGRRPVADAGAAAR